MFSFVTHRQAWIFSQRTAQRCKRERIQADPSTRLAAAIKDGNETNFAIDRPAGDRELRSDLGNPGQTRQEGLHINCSGLSSSWDKCYTSAANSCAPKGYKVIAKSGDAVEEPGDYPFGLNPAGYTSRSMIVICK